MSALNEAEQQRKLDDVVADLKDVQAKANALANFGTGFPSHIRTAMGNVVRSIEQAGRELQSVLRKVKEMD